MNSVLAFSNFLPVRFFGFLVVVSISACLLAAMALMPALVVWLDPRFARAADKPALGAATNRPLQEHL